MKVVKKAIDKLSALLLVSVLLLGSAAIRLGLEIGPALAKQSAPTSQVDAIEEPAQPKIELSESAERKLSEIVLSLKEREKAMQRKEIAIEDRAHALKIAEEAVNKKILELTKIEEKLRETIRIATGASERDLTGLTTVYENMKPKDVAKLFEEMDPDFAAGFIGRIRPEIAAGIMAELSAEAAYAISVVLASRSMSIPKS